MCILSSYLTLVLLNKLRCNAHFQFTANQITWSKLLLWIHILNVKQCRSRSVGFFRSQLIWIYTVCKGRVYPGSAGHGLIMKCSYHFFMKLTSYDSYSLELHFRGICSLLSFFSLKICWYTVYIHINFLDTGILTNNILDLITHLAHRFFTFHNYWENLW